MVTCGDSHPRGRGFESREIQFCCHRFLRRMYYDNQIGGTDTPIVDMSDLFLNRLQTLKFDGRT